MLKGKKSLAETHPEVAKQWHPTKNGDLTPNNLTPGSSKKVWWKCDKGDDHEWETSPKHRKNGTKCPVCSNRIIVKSNSLQFNYPQLAKEWHPTKNGVITPFKVSPGSNKKVWWKCDKGDDHEWLETINARVHGNGCTICSNRKVVSSNCLLTTHPEIAKQWHPTKNCGLTAKDVVIGSKKTVWWKCDKGDDHEWQATIANISGGNRCPFCSNRKVSKTNSLINCNPRLAKEWDRYKNKGIEINNVIYGGKKIYWWKCEKGKDHSWRTSMENRINGRNCPFCTLTPQSKQELTITFELMKMFKNIDPKGLKARLEGRVRSIDIFIPKLNLCIEFDGSYWHKDKRDLDKIKSEMLFDEGFKLIRVRQEPLKKIYDTDVISKKPYNGKQVTNDILSKIINIFNLDNKLVSKIKDYQLKDKLQNEKALERYIDKILTEKVEKKSN